MIGVFAPGKIIVAGERAGMNPVGINALDPAILGPIQGIGLLAFVGALFLGGETRSEVRRLGRDHN